MFTAPPPPPKKRQQIHEQKYEGISLTWLQRDRLLWDFFFPLVYFLNFPECDSIISMKQHRYNLLRLQDNLRKNAKHALTLGKSDSRFSPCPGWATSQAGAITAPFPPTAQCDLASGSSRAYWVLKLMWLLSQWKSKKVTGIEALLITRKAVF